MTQKMKRKSLGAALLAAVLFVALAFTAFCAGDVKTATLKKGEASAYGGVIECRQVGYWGENYSSSDQDMRLVVKKKTGGIWYTDRDDPMVPNSKVGSETDYKKSSYFEKTKSFEISVHAKWAGTRQMVTALRRVSEASFKSTNRGIEKKRFFSMPLINEVGEIAWHC